MYYNSKIEVAYQDAVALKRQEELIREVEEEEAAWVTGIEQNAIIIIIVYISIYGIPILLNKFYTCL